jgi:hypothetical protein
MVGFPENGLGHCTAGGGRRPASGQWGIINSEMGTGGASGGGLGMSDRPAIVWGLGRERAVIRRPATAGPIWWRATVRRVQEVATGNASDTRSRFSVVKSRVADWRPDRARQGVAAGVGEAGIFLCRSEIGHRTALLARERADLGSACRSNTGTNNIPRRRTGGITESRWRCCRGMMRRLVGWAKKCREENARTPMTRRTFMR